MDLLHCGNFAGGGGVKALQNAREPGSSCGGRHLVMTNGFRIDTVRTPDDLDAIRALFAAYAASLAIDLTYQNFAAEQSDLPGQYSAPGGVLLLARGGGGKPLGCVALRSLSAKQCEMKRLHVVEAARGLGLGRSLVSAVIERANSLGYDEIWLDTLPSMLTAQALYVSLGFETIAPYYHPTPPGTVFMALIMNRRRAAV